MDSVLNHTSYLQYRIKTFKGSVFEKNRKCGAKKMAEAGFYFSPTDKESDMVRCYACGIEIFGWSRTTDDPWIQHEKENPDCFYLKVKKSYSNEISVSQFLEIEKYRYLKLNDMLYESKSKAIKQVLEKIENLKSDEEILLTVDSNNSVKIDTKKC